MIALRLEDGSEAWRWTGDGPGLGATPVVYEPGGQPQLIFKTRTQIVGVDPRTGSELWRIPFQVLEDNTITTPLLIGNRLLTLLSNMTTNLNLTDMETCYKAIRADVLERLRLTSDRFGFEPEVTARLAQWGARIYEVPISYHGRTYAEGKNIGAKAFNFVYPCQAVQPIACAGKEKGLGFIQTA